MPPLSVANPGPPVRVYDTATATLREVTPGSDTPASLYVCGITPYDAAHMGHAATYVTFDLLQRVWRAAGHDVRYVQNVTDIDEPLLERADRDGVDWQDLAAREIALYFSDMEALRVLPPDHYVSAVGGIPDVVTAVEELLRLGLAYHVPVPEQEATVDAAARADIYLDLSTQDTFGQVSGWSREQMLQIFGERGGDPQRAGKRDPLDPLLWRAGRTGEPHWPGDSLGNGRPGWHIECSTIAERYLGTPFLVQGGGDDLIFPHHEMSAVQAVARNGEGPFAHAYVHQAMVGLDGEKMSKSKGNLVFVSELRAEGTDPMAIRLVLLSQHYRTPWEWTEGLLADAQQRLQQWRTAARRAGVSDAAADDSGASAEPSVAVSELISRMRAQLAEDLDSPAVLSTVDDWARRVIAGQSELADPAMALAVDALLGVDIIS